MTPLARWLAALAAGDARARHDVARAVAVRAAADGLAYAGPGGVRGIAIALPAAPLHASAQRARVHVARAVLRAVTKAGRAVVDDGGAIAAAVGVDVRAVVLAALSPLEREIVLGAPFRPQLATARADLLADVHGHLWALELNATIPAMQGYSDAAAAALVGVARDHGVDVDVDADATNAARLLRALLARYREDGGTKERPSIALVHRDGDSQRPELLHLARAWQARGHDARCVVVADVDDGVAADVYYRHIFASRVAPTGRFAQLLRAARTHHVYNEVAAPLEEKALLAVVSQAAVDDVLAGLVGFDAADRAAVQAHVPWTRVVKDGAVVDEHGARVDLVPLLRARPADFVLKKSHDFGGKSVVLGDRCDDWFGAIDAALAAGDTVVQRRVHAPTARLCVATVDAAADVDVTVDASAYASAGADVDVDDRGGCVSRAAASPIVNIQSGGGVVALAG